MEWLLILAVVVAVVAAVGHAIWVTLAWLFRAALGGSRPARQDERRRCPFCDHWTPRAGERCDWCGRDLRTVVAQELGDLAAMARQLKRLYEAGVLEPAEARGLLARAREYRKGLIATTTGVRPGTAGPKPAEQRQAEVPAPGGPPKAEPHRKPLAPEQPGPVRRPATPGKAAAAPQYPVRGGPVTIPPPQPQPIAARQVQPPPPAKPETPPAPKPPRKPFLEIISDFLEERNIRWAELLLLMAGLLIVGPSVALAISFRETLEQIPLFRFFVFVAATSAFFGIGLYAYHRWKLRQTGRVLLLTATLMVPLTFVGMVSLSKENWTALNVAWEGVSLAIFACLVGLAGRVLVPRGRWLQAVAVVGSSAAIVLAARMDVAAHGDWLLVAAGCLPVAVLGTTVGGFLHRLDDNEDLNEDRAAEVFILLGTAAFTAAWALGLLIARAAEIDGLSAALDSTSCLFALAAVPILAAGLAVVRGTSRDVALAGYRTAATIVAMLAVLVMLAALGMAWPRPLALIAAGALNAAALAWVALRYRLPIAHAGAIAAASLVYLTGYHVAAGNLDLVPAGNPAPEMLRLAVTAESGAALMGLFALLGVTAELLARRGQRRHAEVYVGGAAVVALASLSMATTHGLLSRGDQSLLAMAVYGVYGAGILALNARFRRPLFTYAGLGLLVGATGWGLWWQTGDLGPEWAMTLAGEALLMAGAAVLLDRVLARKPGAAVASSGGDRHSTNWTEVCQMPLWHLAEAVAVAAVVLGAWTAWADPADIFWSAVPVLTAVFAAACFLLLAWQYRSSERTWVGSLVVMAGLLHTLGCNYSGILDHPWTQGLLAHASVAVAVTLLLRRAAGNRLAPRADDLRRVFIGPLGDAGLLSSALAVVVLTLASWPEPVALAGCLAWLAGIWLAIAWSDRRPALFAACQAVLTAAVAVAAAAWLQRHPWTAWAQVDPLDPRSLHVYGIALGLLTLGWAVVRVALRRNPVARQLLHPRWPAVDRWVGHAVIVGQFLLVGLSLLPGCWDELQPGPTRIAAVSPIYHAFAPTAWLLLGVLAVALAVRLWDRWREAEIATGLLLVATVPCLIAGHCFAGRAVASTLRWELAGLMAFGVAAIWQRRRLEQWCRRIGAAAGTSGAGPWIAQAVLLATTASPVLLLTLAAAAQQLTGASPGGPSPGTLFDRLGPQVSYLVPLVLVIAGLVALALRESSAGYAFTAGLVANMTVVLGYLLGVTKGGGSIGTGELATVVQLVAITASVWAMAWLVARRRAHVWREGPNDHSARVLMNLQVGIAAAAAAVLIVPALVSLILLPSGRHAWTIAAGGWLGWLALAAVVAAFVWRRLQTGQGVHPNLAGLAGMAALGLLGCTVRGLPELEPEWGYRTLMLAWATYALLVVLVTWWVATARTLPGAQGPPQVLIRAASTWVTAAGLAAVLLGLKAAFLHGNAEDRLWAAATIAVASSAGAAMAVWRRREGWAFAAALGANVAASLVVWHFQQGLAFDRWWVLLVQANAIASSAVALVWLAARRRLYELGELTVRNSPLLAVQTALGVVGDAMVLAPPVVALLIAPNGLPAWASHVAAPPGWIAWILAAAGAAWYLRQVAPGRLFHVVGGAALALGVLAACSTTAASGAGPGDWFAYHVLTTAWASVALAAVGVGMLGRNLRLSAEAADRQGPAESPSTTAFSGAVVRAWATAIAGAAVAVALLHCHEDPFRPWWSVRAIVAAGVTAGLLAMWLRRPGYVVISGLLINVAGTVAWIAWGPWTLTGFLHTNVLCLALGSIIWTLLRPAHPRGVPDWKIEGRPVIFAHVAAQIGLTIVGVLAAVAFVQNVVGAAHAAPHRLAWLGLSGVAAATAMCLWDRRARFAVPGIYGAGLIALGMLLDARALGPRAFCPTAAYELAAFVLLGAILAQVLPRMRFLWRALRISPDYHRSTPDWLDWAQALVACVPLVLSLWVSIDFGFDRASGEGLTWLRGRLAGPLGSLALLAAVVLMAGTAAGRWRRTWQVAGFGLATLVLAEVGWAWLDPAWLQQAGASAWLHRNLILFVAAAITTAAAGFGLRRILPVGSDWIEAGQRCVPTLGLVALAALGCVLVQEALLFEQPNGTPMATWAIAVVAVALAGLIATCLAFALTPQWDPLHLSDRGRTGYVYAAEVLAGLIGLHLWLTVPDLFRWGLVEDYWMLSAMLIAFAGAGLSELFHRRGLPILSEPLQRTAVLVPLVPAIGFLFPSEVVQPIGLAGHSPAVWFLGGAFYGILAATRRSIVFTALSVLAANTGLWVLWHQVGLRFVEHPQLWLIPLALAALAAEYLNRDRLTEAWSSGLRYLALSVVYVSSSTEFMVIHRIGESLVLPLVLILLSLLGVLAGVVLRIRSYVHLGVTFLLVVIVTMVWYAAFDQQHTWVLWICCIAMGAAILAAYAVYEKHREHVLAAIRDFRQWQR